MAASDLLKQIYKKFYDQREVLTEAPSLTQEPDISDFDNQKAEMELAGVVSYLMGVPDIREENFDRIIEIIQQHYDNQPEWKGLLVEYFEYQIEKEKETLETQEDTFVREIEEFTEKLLKE